MGRPRLRRMAAISAQVWWSSSLSISAIVLALVCRIFQAGSGTGRVRAWVWPPARRAWAVSLLALTHHARRHSMRLCVIAEALGRARGSGSAMSGAVESGAVNFPDVPRPFCAMRRRL